jgi:hypothetical protein
MRRFFAGKSTRLPDFYIERMRKSLGPLWDALPLGALTHDQNAYQADPTGYTVPVQSTPARIVQRRVA